MKLLVVGTPVNDEPDFGGTDDEDAITRLLLIDLQQTLKLLGLDSKPLASPEELRSPSPNKLAAALSPTTPPNSWSTSTTSNASAAADVPTTVTTTADGMLDEYYVHTSNDITTSALGASDLLFEHDSTEILLDSTTGNTDSTTTTTPTPTLVDHEPYLALLSEIPGYEAALATTATNGGFTCL
jgi:hypothetical protein